MRSIGRSTRMAHADRTSSHLLHPPAAVNPRRGLPLRPIMNTAPSPAGPPTTPDRRPITATADPFGGNGHAPPTTTNPPPLLATARSHAGRVPPWIDTCAPGTRLGRDLGIGDSHEALDVRGETSPVTPSPTSSAARPTARCSCTAATASAPGRPAPPPRSAPAGTSTTTPSPSATSPATGVRRDRPRTQRRPLPQPPQRRPYGTPLPSGIVAMLTLHKVSAGCRRSVRLRAEVIMSAGRRIEIQLRRTRATTNSSSNRVARRHLQWSAHRWPSTTADPPRIGHPQATSRGSGPGARLLSSCENGPSPSTDVQLGCW